MTIRGMSAKGAVAQTWIKRNPASRHSSYAATHTECVSRATFSAIRTKLGMPGFRRGRAAGKQGGPKPKPQIKLTAKAEELISKKTGVKKTVEPDMPHGPPIGSRSDAGTILECAIRVWVAKGSAIIQLRTVVNQVINEYKYIKRMVNKQHQQKE